MLVFVFTVWFAISTLFGSTLCCCLLAFRHEISGNVTVDHSSKTVNSCCGEKSPPCGKNNARDRGPGTPLKCPCKHGKPLSEVMPSIGFDAKFNASAFRNGDTLFVSGMPGLYEKLYLTIPSNNCPPDDSRRISEQTLLAIGSLLRC